MIVLIRIQRPAFLSSNGGFKEIYISENIKSFSKKLTRAKRACLMIKTNRGEKRGMRWKTGNAE